MVGEGDELLQGLFLPLGHDLHPAVGEVAHKAIEAQAPGEIPGVSAEEHPLHAPRHEKVHALHHSSLLQMSSPARRRKATVSRIVCSRSEISSVDTGEWM